MSEEVVRAVSVRGESLRKNFFIFALYVFFAVTRILFGTP
jgi:hypothetical protein